MRLFRLLSFLLVFAATGAEARGLLDWGREDIPAVDVGQLPPEARDTLTLIHRGGPFPYRRDGIRFQNREGRLPDAAPGHYREYTVPTPGSRDRGARRIISGGNPPKVFYYSGDHYRSFRRIQE